MSSASITFTWGSEEALWGIVVHGGAGDVPADARERHRAGARAAAAAGASVLAAGGSAIDAVQRAVEVLEDDPVFNAGTGACLNSDGEIELDAAIMEGDGLAAGAVCALPPFRSPIRIARAALDDGAHVLYAGAGAERFAVDKGFTRSSTAEMSSGAARARWEAARLVGGGASGWAGGTVGAVARDARGHVAAATSTGGMTMKKPGRVGDSPVPGAGTYADDAGGAASATGTGESFMRLCLAKTCTDWMRAGMHPQDAARSALALLQRRVGGEGGIILVDRQGRLGLARTTSTMTYAAMSCGDDAPVSGS